MKKHNISSRGKFLGIFNREKIVIRYSNANFYARMLFSLELIHTKEKNEQNIIYSNTCFWALMVIQGYNFNFQRMKKSYHT